MTAAKPTDTYGYLGTEGVALKEQLEQLAAAIEELAKAEGSQAVKVAGEAARKILARASALFDELPGHAGKVRSAATGQRELLERTIRQQPLLAIAVAAGVGFLVASLRRR